MDLPGLFTKNIRDTFGNEGERWLADLQEIVKECISLWSLTDCRPVGNLSFNYVCRANSAVFGAVILKIGVRGHEIGSEYRALSLMDPQETCRCFAFDRKLNAMLLEQLLPGHNLYSLSSIEEQIRVGGELISGVSGEPGGVSEEFPAYKDWLNRSFNKVKKMGRIDSHLEAILEKADSYFRDLENSSLPDRLLHGDFHHQNILMKGEDWVLIDPKGVIGKQVFDCGRFFLNQLAELDNNEHSATIRLMASIFAKALNTGRKEVLKGAYIEKVLSCCWTLEGNISPDEIQRIRDELIYTDKLYGELINE